MNATERQREFFAKLADLLDEYKASIWAAHAEDGGFDVCGTEFSMDWDVDEIRHVAEHGMTAWEAHKLAEKSK